MISRNIGSLGGNILKETQIRKLRGILKNKGVTGYAKNSNSPQFANNLIVYNLEKKIIQIIPPPKPKNWINSDSIYSLGEKKIFEGKEYIAVSIFKSDENDNRSGQEEIHYLNLENFEYHPLYFESNHDYGR